MTHSKHRHLETKIFAPDNRQGLRRMIRYHQFFDRSIVFTNGCFDVLHAGHVDLLSRAADLGDVLIVGLNSDDSVRRLKGSLRPLNDQHARATMLAALSFVRVIALFEEDTPENLIRTIVPDVLVKGGDYRSDNIVGAGFVRQNGGRVVTLPLLQGYSTTDLVNKITTTRNTDGLEE